MLGDPALGQALVNTVWWTAGSLLFQFALGLALALLLNRDLRGRQFVQAVVFLPWAVPSFLAGLTWAWLFNPVIGPLPHWYFASGCRRSRRIFCPIRHRDVGADPRQCLVRRAVLRHHPAGRAEIHSQRALRGGGARRRKRPGSASPG